MKMPSHSTVVAYLALFVALGGSAYAVSKIDSGDIQNRSIEGKDVADDALGGRQIDEGKLIVAAGGGRRALGRRRLAIRRRSAGRLRGGLDQAPAARRGLLVIATGKRGRRSPGRDSAR